MYECIYIYAYIYIHVCMYVCVYIYICTRHVSPLAEWPEPEKKGKQMNEARLSHLPF